MENIYPPTEQEIVDAAKTIRAMIEGGFFDSGDVGAADTVVKALESCQEPKPARAGPPYGDL